MRIDSGTNVRTARRAFIFRGAALIASIAACSAAGQTPGPVRGDAIRAHVEFLADDLLEGRGTGSRGYALAAAYVAAQFQQLGLAPGGDRTDAAASYLQTVPLLEATPVLPGSAAKLTYEGKSVAFEYSADYLPSADYSAPNATLTAPLAFVGFGVTAPELDYDDFAGVDVRDRIAVVLSGAPAKFPHNQRAYYSWSGSKYPNLIEHGAVGVIVVDTPADAARTPWERRVAMSWQPQMRWLDANDQPVDAYPELKQSFRFNREAAAKLLQGGAPTLDDVFAAAEAGSPQAFELPGLVTLTTTTGLRRTESHNVVGILRGSDPQLRRQYIVISAHLDHLGRGAAVNGDAIYNGAHDNASGIAVLLETARSIVSSGAAPKRSIIFLAVTAEEKGLLGSDFFAQHPGIPKNAIVANINIDMPMLFGPTRDVMSIGAQHTTLGPAAERAANAQGYIMTPDNAPAEVRFIRSDQFSFIKQGVPSIYLGGGYYARSRSPDIEALREEFFRTHYHRPSDDLSLPMHYAGAVDLALINARLALEIANQTERPRWHRGDFFGVKFGRTARSAAK
jgi:hypothetical protein